jgi:hypothetical protein
LNDAQLNYPVTDKEMLSIAEGLKHFDSMVRGAKIRVYTDHKNLTHGDTTAHVGERILRQMILITQDYNCELIHIAGEDNSAGDALSRMPSRASTIEEKEIFMEQRVHDFDFVFPLDRVPRRSAFVDS